MIESTKELHRSFIGFVHELTEFHHSLRAWLDGSKESIHAIDKRSTAHACNAVRNSIVAVRGFLGTLENPEDHDYQSLQAIVDTFSERDSDYDDHMEKNGDQMTVTEVLTDLTTFIESTYAAMERILEDETWKDRAFLSWLTGDDLHMIHQDIGFHLGLISRQFEILRLLVVELVDPQYLEIAIIAAKIEDSLKELKSKTAISVKRP
jgi:hypothetical protein